MRCLGRNRVKGYQRFYDSKAALGRIYGVTGCDLTGERAALAREHQVRLEMANGLRRGELMETASLEFFLDNAFLIARQHLFAIPVTMSPSCYAAKSIRGVHALLMKALNEATVELSTMKLKDYIEAPKGEAPDRKPNGAEQAAHDAAWCSRRVRNLLQAPPGGRALGRSR
jgi:hypothetical protein